MKNIKGDKYIYLAMAYRLAKEVPHAIIGYDNGAVGGFHYWRRFIVQKYKDKELLIETKTSKNMADYSRAWEVRHYSKDRPDFYEYISESGENESKRWKH